MFHVSYIYKSVLFDMREDEVRIKDTDRSDRSGTGAIFIRSKPFELAELEVARSSNSCG